MEEQRLQKRLGVERQIQYVLPALVKHASKGVVEVMMKMACEKV